MPAVSPIRKGQVAQTIQDRLLEPFSDDQISERDGFSYVDPYHYRKRLIDLFPNGFKFHVDSVVVGKSSMTGQARFKASVDDVEFDINVPCAEDFIKARETGDVIKFPQSMNMLTSAGLKAISREIGLGLHLYQKTKSSVNTKTGSGGAAASGKADASWDGSKAVTFGKHKGEKWSDVDADYLAYITSGDKPNELAQKEIARRSGNAKGAGQSQAANAVTPDDDDGVPF